MQKTKTHPIRCVGGTGQRLEGGFDPILAEEHREGYVTTRPRRDRIQTARVSVRVV